MTKSDKKKDTRRKKGPTSLHVSELTESELEAIRSAQMDPKYDDLNTELENDPDDK